MTTRDWPRPPSCLPAARLDEPPEKARVTVAGLVIVRQRPGTASGVIFLTLEDETGIANVVVWAKLYERFRREVIAGRLLRVTGRVQRDGQVVHVVAEFIEDISYMLDDLARGAPSMPEPVAMEDEARGARLPRSQPPAGGSGIRPQSPAHHPQEQTKKLFPSRDFH